MASTVVLKAMGLNTSPNQLNVEEGSMLEASNIIVRRDGIIEQRRGYKLYGDSLPSVNQRTKQLLVYRDRLLRHASNFLQVDATGTGTFETYTGNVTETQTGLRIKPVESNGNLYFTTSEGIKKLSATSGTTLSASNIESAGAVKALDIEGQVVYTANQQTGFFTQDSAVAYRMVWVKEDNNDNRIDGTPSQRAVIYNPLDNLILQDFGRLLGTLDNLVNSPTSAARINDKNYVNTLLLPITASASQLRTNLISLATKIDNDIFYADQAAVAPLQIASASITSGICTVTFSSGAVSDYLLPGSKIFLAGFAPATGELNGAQTVVTSNSTTITFNTSATGAVVITTGTIVSNIFRDITQPAAPNLPATNDDLVELQTYLDEIILALQNLNTFIIAAGTDADSITSLDITTTTNVQLSFTIPEEIANDSSYFYQVFRSGLAIATGATVLDDISPDDELQLVYEEYPTAAELAVGSITFTDVTPEDFRGENLYTNASTGEGITQANDQPPFAKDVARYKNSVFFANTRTKHRLQLNLLGVQNMINDYDAGTVPKFSITNGETTNTYSFITGQQEIRRWLCNGDTANNLDGKYLLINTPEENFYAWFSTSGGSALDPMLVDRTAIRVNILTGATAATVAQRLKDEVSLKLTKFITQIITSTTVEISNIDVGNILTNSANNELTASTAGFGYTQVQSGRGEQLLSQISSISTIMTGNDFLSSGVADYFTLNTAYDQFRYVLWFKKGTVTQPVVSGATYIQINITGTETNQQVLDKIIAAIPSTQFSVEQVSSFTLNITNRQFGLATDAAAFVFGSFTVGTIQDGAVDILLSPLASPARAVDETARSIVRVLNKNLGESVYVYYLSGAFDIPGQMLLEARDLTNTEPFYVTANNDNTGTSFNPTISPEISISNISIGVSSVVITTSAPHGYENNDEVIIVGSNSEPLVDGLYTITYINSTSFSISAFVSVSGSAGSVTKKTEALTSENEQKANRVYYSKFQQPEAVPIVNFFDVGAEDKQILRIIALRDSLFVFKEDGLYRISGEGAPFQLELFDNSYILLAPDSAAVCNNVVYSWTTQGIQSLTEGGSYVISRSIDNIVLKTQSSNFTNFKTATWGVGYESDNSYLVFTVINTGDTVSQICYRYSTLTQTWTTYDKSNTCGVINNFDDKLYLGASDVSFIEQERKSFNRTDYADREYELSIGSNGILNAQITLPDVTNITVGDVITQDQTITIYEYNLILKKLDLDTGVADSDYFSTLQMVRGDSPRDKLVALAAKLDADTMVDTTTFLSSIEALDGTITNISGTNPSVLTSTAHGLIDGRIIRISDSDSTPSIDGEYAVTVIDANTFSIPVSVRLPGTSALWETVNDDFEDLRVCYNKIVSLLNDDINVNFANYRPIDNNTLQEAIITAINRITRKVTVNLQLEFIVGACTVYKSIRSTFTYAPTTFGDPLSLKHLSEATIMFETRNITSATLSFASDLLPEFIDIPFNLDGNGIFGHSPAFGSGFFGGLSNSAPFRTYIPRQCQRCRYIVAKYTHNVAREDYKILGMTATGNITPSTRAFR